MKKWKNVHEWLYLAASKAKCDKVMQEGPWKTEPDKVFWTDEKTGMACLINRGPVGSLCGYVGVPKEHPWFGKNYSDCTLPQAKPRGERPEDGQPISIGIRVLPPMPKSILEYTQKKLVCGEDYCKHSPESLIKVHGGLTYANSNQGPISCGDKMELWWFGFDCAHAWDISPGMGYHPSDAKYRDILYVKAEVEKLAKQLKEIK